MGSILSNWKLPYRYKNLILRTPLNNVPLRPNGAAYYSIAGRYTSGVNLPETGFTGPMTQNDVIAAGYQANSAFLNPPTGLQIWREADPALLPETLYYQGTYAPSAPNPSQSCEAYGQLCGYKFRVPDGLSLTKCRIQYTLGGVVECFGNASAKSSKNKKGWANASDWLVSFGVIDGVAGRNMSYIAKNAATNTVDLLPLSNGSSGTAQGFRDVWGKLWATTIRGRDGAIPTLTMPSAQGFDATATQLQAMNRLREFWIVPFYNAFTTNPTTYGPRYVPSAS